MIRLKRVYERSSPSDGQRILVERLWPRGITKERAALDSWAKEVAPSEALRRWYRHDPNKWEEFRRRYREELGASPHAWRPILQAARRGNVTFVYSARDPARNSAVVLREYLEERMASDSG